MTRSSIEIILGPMFSGKTTEELRRVERVQLAGKEVLVMKPEIDTRYGTTIVTDRNKNMEVKAVMIPTELDEEAISYILSIAEDFEVVAVDEVQFFSKGIVTLCRTLRDKGKRVILCGLDMDYRAEPFGFVGDLMAIANQVTKLQAVCIKCGGDAFYTQRLLDGEPAPEGELVEIGDKGKTTQSKFTYDARCQGCYVHPSKVELKETV